MYRISCDEAGATFEIELGGMLSIAEVEAYIGNLRREFVARRVRAYSMLIDVTACPIQSQDTVRAMGEHMATMPKARALAIVTGSSLSRMQIRRLFKQDYARMFDTVREAREWVNPPAEPR